MRETASDIHWLQQLLDTSHEQAGSHLRSVFSDEHRPRAEEIATRLAGVRVISLATVTAGGEPRVGPVDGLFFRGKFHFGTSERAFRLRNVRRNPAVSAAYSEGERFAVIVHGRAVELDRDDPANADFWDCCGEVYPDWSSWGEESPYAVIEPDRMYGFAGAAGLAGAGAA